MACLRVPPGPAIDDAVKAPLLTALLFSSAITFGLAQPANPPRQDALPKYQ